MCLQPLLLWMETSYVLEEIIAQLFARCTPEDPKIYWDFWDTSKCCQNASKPNESVPNLFDPIRPLGPSVPSWDGSYHLQQHWRWQCPSPWYQGTTSSYMLPPKPSLTKMSPRKTQWLMMVSSAQNLGVKLNICLNSLLMTLWVAFCRVNYVFHPEPPCLL